MNVMIKKINNANVSLASVKMDLLWGWAAPC